MRTEIEENDHVLNLKRKNASIIESGTSLPSTWTAEIPSCGLNCVKKI
jgi:hypothetical protein